MSDRDETDAAWGEYSRRTEISRLRAENEALREDIHLANGVADLAIKHRDAAEAEAGLLRGLLAEARDDVSAGLSAAIAHRLKPNRIEYYRDLLARIDAALGEQHER